MISATPPAERPSEYDELTAWALRAREGDPVAQAAFVRQSQEQVWRMCAALVSPAEADDLTQDIYLRAFRSLPDFLARSTARTWLLSIARNTCADHLRGKARRQRLDNVLRRARPVTEPDPAGAAVSYDLLRPLTEDRRSAFVLTQLIGLSYAEAARIEDVPVGTIRSRVARARDELVAAVTASTTV